MLYNISWASCLADFRACSILQPLFPSYYYLANHILEAQAAIIVLDLLFAKSTLR